MTPEQFKQFTERQDELLLKAVQSGKQETSGLVDHIIHKMESKIEESINKNVNGKLDKMHIKIDNYIATDNEWKVKYSPYLEGIVGVSVGGKIMLKVLLGFASIGGAVLAIKAWFK